MHLTSRSDVSSKKTIEKDSATGEHITPQSFDALIVHGPSCNKTATSWTSERMLEHVIGNANVVSTSVCPHTAGKAKGCNTINEEL